MKTEVSVTASRIAALRDYFVSNEWFVPLEERLSQLMERRLADLSADRITDARGIALSDASLTSRSLGNKVSTTAAGHSRLKSSIMFRMQDRRPQ